MNGPEHYRAAERLLGGEGARPGTPAREQEIAAAQVHATLAFVAAAAADQASSYDGDERYDRIRGWARVV